MARGLKLIHLLGLVLALGSIFTFIVVSSLTRGASLENLTFGRQIISAGTVALTLPGMGLLAVTGGLLAYRQYGFGLRFSQLKLLLMVLVILNAFCFILPAEEAATELARQSLAQGLLSPEYEAAYIRESIFGAANVAFIIAAAVVGVWKIGVRRV